MAPARNLAESSASNACSCTCRSIDPSVVVDADDERHERANATTRFTL
jgi:hypothetical protein